MFKLTLRLTLLLFLLSLLSVSSVRAQGMSAYFGIGSAFDSAGTSAGCASGNLFDDFTGVCEPGPTIGGAFGVFGADLMFRPHFGVNGEYAFRFAQDNYLPNAGLKYRPAFYDFNAVWEPISGAESKIQPVIEGGVGGARVDLYFNQTACVTGICSNFSQPAGLNANHFQVHAAVGVKLYVSGNIFIKPQFDYHYVHNLTDQFGRDSVPQFTVAVGYTFGQR